jgi:pimeloyl-ACP methyl ester carboxylesterase
MDPTSRILPVNGIRLHVVEAGPPDGPLVILLHGFPDFSWGWRHQLEPLAAAGYRVVVPDQRGYALSDKPRGPDAYRLDVLVADVIALADACGGGAFRLVGHDWGGIVAWETAIRYPERVEQLVILNAPHPDVGYRAVRRRPRQLLRSWYVGFFQIPGVPEFLLRLRRFALLRRALTGSARPGTFSQEELNRYVEAWSSPGTLTAMLNYYRALRRKARRVPAARVEPPTLILWGVRDRFLERVVAELSLDLCQNGRIQYFDTATHWVLLEEAPTVNAAVLGFFRVA